MAVDHLSVVVSEKLKASISQVWENEVCKITEPLFRPKNLCFAKFFPTDACNDVTGASFSEFFSVRTFVYYLHTISGLIMM